MRIKALKTLLFLAENNCDFSAHKLLGIPRSTMWAHVSELEAETGLRLINRRKQLSTFTEEGLAFLPYARKFFDTYEEALKNIKDPSFSELEGEITISTTQAVAASWLMPSIKEFYAQYPHLKVHVIVGDEVSKKVEVSSDIMLRPLGESVELKKVWHITYHHGLFASPDYLKRTGVPKRPEDLYKHSLMGYGEHEFTYFSDINWHLNGKWGLPKLRPSLTINSTISLHMAAIEGIGICSTSIESNEIYNSELVRVLPDIEGPVIHTYFAMKENVGDIKQKNIEIFKEFFDQYLKKVGVKVEYE